MGMYNDVEHFPVNVVVFSDEATNYLNRTVNRHSSQEVNVWMGIVQKRLTGPFFIDGHLTANNYLGLRNNQIIPTEWP